jgi:hypothetical protein
MRFMRQVVVFDAADLAAESAFWAGMLGHPDDEAVRRMLRDHGSMAGVG